MARRRCLIGWVLVITLGASVFFYNFMNWEIRVVYAYSEAANVDCLDLESSTALYIALWYLCALIKWVYFRHRKQMEVVDKWQGIVTRCLGCLHHFCVGGLIELFVTIN